MIKKIWAQVVRVWRIVSIWFVRTCVSIRPGPETRRGAVWGTLVAVAATVMAATLSMHTGFGYAFDFVFSTIVAAVVIGTAMLLIFLLMTLGRRLPRLATGFVVGCFAVVFLIWGTPVMGATMALAICLSAGVLGATIRTFSTGAYREAGRAKKVLTVVFFLASIAGNLFIFWLLTEEGSLEKLTAWKPASMPQKLAAADPTGKGSYPVKLMFYGVGNDVRRPEYGARVGIKTRTVDASLFFEEFKGWKRWVRKTYWGFDMDKLPLNARVWYPEGPGPFPLVLMVHGNHTMSEFSDPGYAYLGELLASRGFILASVDENFLNSGLFHDPPKQQAVRGWMLLEHLKLWREWNLAAGNPFRGKVDMSRIALMGHSRGGEAVATAAAFNHMQFAPENANIRFDYGFEIQSLVAIAPVDGQYKPAGRHRWISDVNYLTLQGAHDADVSSFMGSRQWDHLRYTKNGPWFKTELYAYRANHGQFNTVWGRSDAGDGPASWLLNLKALMPGPEQRRISKTYISAFLEATLHGRREYLPLFQDWRVGRDWVPDTIYLNRYQDASYVPLAGFQEDADLTTTTAEGGKIAGENLSVWKEGPIPWRAKDRDYNGVTLGWKHAKGAPFASYTLTLPEGAAAGWKLGPDSTLELSVAALDRDVDLPGKDKDKDKDRDKDQQKDSKKKDREAPDFTVELVTSDGGVASVVAGRFAAIPPPLKETFTKLGPLESQEYEKDWEPVFQSVRIPLAAFQKAGGPAAFDVRKVSAVRLKFDRTVENAICISGVGFGNGR
jgi:dienelactone hydrolase